MTIKKAAVAASIIAAHADHQNSSLRGSDECTPLPAKAPGGDVPKQHTPGAWVLDRQSAEVEKFQNSLGTYFHGMFTVRAGRVLICTLSRSVDGEDPTASGEEHQPGSWDELHAIANLIAAAPELLEALRDLLAYVNINHDPHGTIRELPTIAAAVAAIAKAEGRQHV